jgi:hypothetical protein
MSGFRNRILRDKITLRVGQQRGSKLTKLKNGRPHSASGATSDTLRRGRDRRLRASSNRSSYSPSLMKKRSANLEGNSA